MKETTENTPNTRHKMELQHKYSQYYRTRPTGSITGSRLVGRALHYMMAPTIFFPLVGWGFLSVA